eukprot:8927353-Alexandrium_andersonii.AAC.1
MQSPTQGALPSRAAGWGRRGRRVCENLWNSLARAGTGVTLRSGAGRGTWKTQVSAKVSLDICPAFQVNRKFQPNQDGRYGINGQEARR